MAVALADIDVSNSGVWSKYGTAKSAACLAGQGQDADSFALHHHYIRIPNGKTYLLNTPFASFDENVGSDEDLIECDRDEQADERMILDAGVGMCPNDTMIQPRERHTTLGWDEHTLGHPSRTWSLDLDHEGFHLLQFFVQQVAPACTLSSTYNPYLEFIAPRAHASSSLLHVVLGIAASELQFRQRGNLYNNMAIQLRTKALEGLQEEIALARQPGNDTLFPQIAATTLMLCFWEVCALGIHFLDTLHG